MRGYELACSVLLVVAPALGCKGESGASTPPLHRAVGRRDVPQIKSLLDGDADANGRDGQGRTALHLAARSKTRQPPRRFYRPTFLRSNPPVLDPAEVIAALLDGGADINARDSAGRTPLHYAVRYGEKQVAGLLLSRGADVNATDGKGDTPMHMAAFRGQLDLAELVLNHGGKIDVADKAGYTPLHVAAGGQHDAEFVGFFLAHGADINAIDKAGQTPVAHAARVGNFEVVRLLLAKGAKPPTRTGQPDGAGTDPAAAMVAVARPEVQSLVADNSAFAIDLYRQLRGREGNLFFSPYSISVALAMTYAGARGETERQMAETLHFSLGQEGLHPAFAGLRGWLNLVQERGDVVLYTANSLWPQEKYPFLREYLDLVEQHYGVSITPVDYVRAAGNARRRINGWVESQTRGKIANIIPEGLLNALTRLVLVNAIYFKGKWAEEFDPARTKPDTFHVSPERTVSVPMMHQTTMAHYAELDGMQILGFPYRGQTLSMLVLLPRQIDGLTDLEERLSAEPIRAWRRSLCETMVQVYLPRFWITSRFRLEEMLPSMGMVDAFIPEEADFCGMDGQTKWLYTSTVLHKAFVEVNEEGAEAAAATAVAMSPPARRDPTEPPTFRADHPFLFLIQENRTGAILFIGRVTDPTRHN